MTKLTVEERSIIKVALRALKVEFYNSKAVCNDCELKQNIQVNIDRMDKMIGLFDKSEVKVTAK